MVGMVKWSRWLGHQSGQVSGVVVVAGWSEWSGGWVGGDGLLRSFNDFLVDLLWLRLLLQDVTGWKSKVL